MKHVYDDIIGSQKHVLFCLFWDRSSYGAISFRRFAITMATLILDDALLNKNLVLFFNKAARQRPGLTYFTNNLASEHFYHVYYYILRNINIFQDVLYTKRCIFWYPVFKTWRLVDLLYLLINNRLCPY